MKIDHVSIAWSDLAFLEEQFASAGMKTEYGGPHSGGLTHMSLLGFDDGSYFELISSAKVGVEPSIWRKQIEGNGGPCAWAVRVDDLAGELAKAKSLGIPTSGPGDYTRKRPDGVLVEWQLGFLGGGEPGSVLPFLIQDTTPREYRVRPSPSVSGPGALLTGIGTVVLGVDDLEGTVALFRRLYGWGEPETDESLFPGARVAYFGGTPVAVAAPAGSSWLTERIRRFGASPCAFLVETSDQASAEARYPLEGRQSWFDGRKLAWIRPLRMNGIMVGIVG